MNSERVAIIGGGAAVGVFGVLTMCLMFAGCPHYNVWQQGLAGQAELERAKQSRQIKIEEARAAKESATMLAEAEVERAKGVAPCRQRQGR